MLGHSDASMDTRLAPDLASSPGHLGDEFARYQGPRIGEACRSAAQCETLSGPITKTRDTKEISASVQWKCEFITLRLSKSLGIDLVMALLEEGCPPAPQMGNVSRPHLSESRKRTETGLREGH